MKMFRYRSTSHWKELVALSAYVLIGACSAQRPIQYREIDQLGSFQFRDPVPGMMGVIVGAPHGGTVSGLAELARHVSDRTGAGLAIAQGFKSKRVSVAQPVVRSNPYQPVPVEPAKRRSVFREFKQVLRQIANGEIDLYVELRSRATSDGIDGIQAVSSGFTFEEVKMIKQSYVAASDRFGATKTLHKPSLSIEPIDRISGETSGIRHHGVLMIAEKGLSLGIPEKFLALQDLRVYGEILAAWLNDITRLVYGNPRRAARIEVKVMDLGRIDSIPSRAGRAGIVIGAPHGSYDEYTAEIVKQLAFETGWAAVIARGFTPTEAGGWRINVNRPSEKTFPAPEIEIQSARSEKVYRTFKNIVFDAAGGDLRLYFDVHQYGSGESIQIATVGLTTKDALRIKQNYQRIRDSLLKVDSDTPAVELLIEPLDNVEIGAWPAKAHGILSVARKSLHMELPLHSALGTEKSREAYTTILAEFVKQTARELTNDDQL
jgi:hypothetical protein